MTAGNQCVRAEPDVQISPTGCFFLLLCPRAKNAAVRSSSTGIRSISEYLSTPITIGVDLEPGEKNIFSTPRIESVLAKYAPNAKLA